MTVGAAVGAFAGVVLLLLAAESATSVSTRMKIHWRATVATLPANAGTLGVSLHEISCASPGNCTAVGTYYDNADHQQGLLLTEKAGHWARGVEAPLPADATPEPDVHLDSVSCASAGNCSAVGEYMKSNDGPVGLLLTEIAGHWAPAVEGEPAFSVSCSSPGNCTAVGGGGGLLIAQRAGKWRKAVKAPLPADARTDQEVFLSSVSCAADGSCSAVGSYNIVSDLNIESAEGVLLTKKRGTWRAVRAVLPPDGPVLLTSVSCASGGNCAAVGWYDVNIELAGSTETVLLTEKAGTWQRGFKPPFGVNGPSCPSPGNCVAVSRGRFGHVRLLTEKTGKWRRGVAVVLPSRFHQTFTSGISCSSAGNCAVTGSYSDDNGHRHDFLLTEIAGHWARGVKALPVYSELSSVSCPSPGRCGAAGAVGGASPYGILLDSSITG
jgi:hypothetical protein